MDLPVNLSSPSPEILVLWQAWRVTMLLGQVRGCRPDLDIEAELEVVRAREGKVNSSSWPVFLGPTLKRVDEPFAACLVGTLDQIIAEMIDPTLGQSHFVGGSDSIFLTKLQLELIPLEEFQSIRDLAAGGAFNIDRTWDEVRMWR